MLLYVQGVWSEVAVKAEGEFEVEMELVWGLEEAAERIAAIFSCT